MNGEKTIRVRLLGTAAGGGLPQWNCACSNCLAARRGIFPSRTQSSVAISVEGGPWFLVNASPDLRAQLEMFPGLQPSETQVRATLLSDVLLTNADLDHVLGLFLLREHRQKLRVHCTAAVRDTLSGALQMGAVLNEYCGVEWRDLPESPALLGSTNLTYRAIPLPGGPPRYAKGGYLSDRQSVALEFVDERRGARLVVAPDVAAITPELSQALDAADAVIFDGTFWSEDELRRVDPVARTASEMGHLPVSRGSLDALRKLRAQTRVYIHINNTNPMLAPDSAERAEVAAAGIIVGEDGMEFEL